MPALTRLAVEPCRHALALLALLASVLLVPAPVPAGSAIGSQAEMPWLDAGMLRDLADRIPAQARLAVPSGEGGQDGGSGPPDLAGLPPASIAPSPPPRARAVPVPSRPVVASPAGFSFRARAPPAA